jgi:lipopolysaccharide transport system ATP-binding protein
MSADIAIRVEGLGKRYTLGRRAAAGRFRYERFSDVLLTAAKAPLVWLQSQRRGSNPARSRADEEFWALQDVSFEVKEGEVLGIIGRNGAGKSTLLKVLSRITEPTRGRIELGGRVASLLEVGTGFHPELTGRENIYLNGAILGMERAEIRRKFDAIVAFADVDRFLDTPVKRYSSGMYVRLAFAVAAHLEPEILVVDEVLAVGDALFQKKCLGKMREVATTEGRTVLFVSHSMHAIRELCSRVLLLEAGRIKLDGTPRDAMAAYLSSDNADADIRLDTRVRQGPRHHVKLTRLRLLDGSGQPTTTFVMNEPFVAQIELECIQRMANAEIGLKISSHFGAAIHYLTSTWEGLLVDLEPGSYTFEVKVPHVWLLPGIYLVGLWVLRDGDASDEHIQEITQFTVIKGDVTGHRTRVEQYAYSGCEVHTPSVWKLLNVTPGPAP